MPKDPVDWEDSCAKRWIDGITKPSTRRYYKSALRIYVNFTGLSPSQLVDEALEDARREQRERQDVVVRRLLAFHSWLKMEYGVRSRGQGEHRVVGKGVSEKVANTYVNVVRSFYDTFGISVKLKGRHALPKGKVKNRRIRVSAEQVRTLVDHARTPRDRVIILTLFQSGMDVSTLCSLKYGDVAEGLARNELPLKLDLYRPKTGVEYFTFLGRDAVEATRAYIKDCEARGIRFTQETPLFLTERGREPVETHNVQNMLREVATRAGFITEEERANPRFFSPISSHALRESFGSIMINSGVPDTVVDFWLGHSIGEMAEAYKAVQFESVRKMYSERERLISPFGAAGSGAEVSKLKREVEEGQKELQRLVVSLAARIRQLEEQFARLKREVDERLREAERIAGRLEGASAGE